MLIVINVLSFKKKTHYLQALTIIFKNKFYAKFRFLYDLCAIILKKTLFANIDFDYQFSRINSMRNLDFYIILIEHKT
jgi:hypothetical protein